MMICNKLCHREWRSASDLQARGFWVLGIRLEVRENVQSAHQGWTGRKVGWKRKDPHLRPSALHSACVDFLKQRWRQRWRRRRKSPFRMKWILVRGWTCCFGCDFQKHTHMCCFVILATATNKCALTVNQEWCRIMDVSK
jgi:hypothetical protein